VSDPRFDSHCGRAGCPCPHTDPCYKGFEDYMQEDHKWIAMFCHLCRGQQRRIVDEAQSPEQRGQRLRARSIAQQWTGA